jgi:hypothetical protein
MPPADDQFVTVGKRVLTKYDPDFAIIGLLEPVDLIDGNQRAAMNAHELIREFILERFQ